MKFLSIGDIHGRNVWKQANMEEHDKVIFIGDYTDSYTLENTEILRNLQEIILRKKEYPEKYELLLGNHDIQYRFFPNYRCTGYRPEMQTDLGILFNENKHIFKIAFQFRKYLWTHAGVSINWLKKHKEHFVLFGNETIADKLNKLNESHLRTILFEVGHIRGGLPGNHGGPLWADISETIEGTIPDYHQIVGHTPVKQIITCNTFQGKVYDDRSITFIDVLESDLDFYSLSI